MYVGEHVCIPHHPQVHTCMYMHAHTCAHAHTHTHTHTHTQAQFLLKLQLIFFHFDFIVHSLVSTPTPASLHRKRNSLNAMTWKWTEILSISDLKKTFCFLLFFGVCAGSVSVCWHHHSSHASKAMLYACAKKNIQFGKLGSSIRL